MLVTSSKYFSTKDYSTQYWSIWSILTGVSVELLTTSSQVHMDFPSAIWRFVLNEAFLIITCRDTRILHVAHIGVLAHFLTTYITTCQNPCGIVFSSCSDFSNGLLGQTFKSLVSFLALLLSADTVSWRGNRCCSIPSSTVHSSKYVDNTSLEIFNKHA